MKSAVESLSPTRAKLTVEVPFEELEPNVAEAYKRIAKQINVPGFRRGKVPPPVIDRQVGRGAVLDEALHDALPHKYLEALTEHALQPLTQPEIEVTRFEDREALEFTAVVDVRPEIELPEYDGLEAQVDDVEVTDADVEEQLHALRRRFGTLVDVDRALAEGDFAVIDLVATQDGEPVEGAELTGMSYEVGSGGMLDGLDEVLVGMAAGESRTFATKLVGGDLVGEAVDVSVTVTQVQEQELPEIDDEFAQLASEFDTAEELTADIRTRLDRGRRFGQAMAARDAVLARLLERVDVPLPQTLVADELDSRRAMLESQLAGAGTTLDDYLEGEEQTIEQFEADLEQRVRDSLAAQFVLDEIAKREQLDVEQAELTQHIVRRAQQSGEDPQKFADHMVEHNHLPELVEEVRRAKALGRIVDSARVTDASGNVVDLRPEGEIAAPSEESSGAEADQPVTEAPPEGSATRPVAEPEVPAAEASAPEASVTEEPAPDTEER